MAKRYSTSSDALLERSVKERTSDGKIDWQEVLKEVSEETGKSQTLGALKMRYRRLLVQNGVERSSRAGDKTWERFKKFFDNFLDSNWRMRAQLDVEKSKRRNSAQLELLKKESSRKRLGVLRKRSRVMAPSSSGIYRLKKASRSLKQKKRLSMKNKYSYSKPC